jgi:hypothetical protein
VQPRGALTIGKIVDAAKSWDALLQEVVNKKVPLKIFKIAKPPESLSPSTTV